MSSGETAEGQYINLAAGLKKIGIVYIHIVDHSSMAMPAVPQSVKDGIRNVFGVNIILSGGYDSERAEADLEAGKGELVAFCRPFIFNPDLIEKIQAGEELVIPNPTTFYTPGEKGYIDYAEVLQMA